MFRSIAFDMSEDTEESFEIPEDDEYRNKSEEEEIQNVEQSPTRNSLSKEFLDRKSKMKVVKNKSGIKKQDQAWLDLGFQYAWYNFKGQMLSLSFVDF